MALKGKRERDPNFRVVFKGIARTARQWARLMKKRNVAHRASVDFLAKIRQKHTRATRRADRRSARGPNG